MFATIEKLNLDRGFAWARINGTDRDVFVHASALQPPLAFDASLIGERVDLELIDVPNKGYRATVVRQLEFV